MRPPSEERIVLNAEDVREVLSPPLGRLHGARLSWAGVLAGLFVAIAVQFLLAALGTWAGFGVAKINAINDFAEHATRIGLYVALVAFISGFAGGFVASWLASAWTVGSGLWHGAITWAFSLVLTVLFSAYFGSTGILGFNATPGGVFRYFPGATDLPADTVTTVTARYAGWFLLGAVLALAAALIGGWMGTRNRGDVAGVKGL